MVNNEIMLNIFPSLKSSHTDPKKSDDDNNKQKVHRGIYDRQRWDSCNIEGGDYTTVTEVDWHRQEVTATLMKQNNSKDFGLRKQMFVVWTVDVFWATSIENGVNVALEIETSIL